MSSNAKQSTFRPQKILFVLNAGSGRKSRRISQQVFADFCTDNQIEYQLAVLGLNDIKALYRSFSPDLVVAAGGDGTVNAVATLVLHTATPLGVIPMGSSNGFAKNLSIPENHRQAFETLINGHVKTIDTLLINNHHCFHICDIGINAALIARSQHSKIRGTLVYAINLLKELFTFHFFRYAVETATEKIAAKAFAIIITSERKFGTNAIINPKGKLNDGLFEICIIKPFPIYKLFSLVYKVFRKSINSSGFSIFLRTDKAVIHNIDKEHVHIDGEPIKFKGEIDISILPHSLQVVVPKSIA